MYTKLVAPAPMPQPPRTTLTHEGHVASHAFNPSLKGSSRKLQVGAVAYLNTKPLIYGLEESLGPFGTLRLALPSRLAVELEAGSLDVGLIPVVEYLRHRERYRIVSDVAIACRGPVWSVRVLFRVPPAAVRTLAIDEGSRSSVALASLLFHSRFGSIPDFVPFPIDAAPESTTADAVLVIGDRAMRPERYRDTFTCDWDLGEEWFRETGLPFVFAMWVAREEAFATTELAQLLEHCRDQGLLHVDALVRRYSGDYGISESQCRDYLTRYLRFHFGPEEEKGLEEYDRRCRAIGLVAQLDPFPVP